MHPFQNFLFLSKTSESLRQNFYFHCRKRLLFTAIFATARSWFHDWQSEHFAARKQDPVWPWPSALKAAFHWKAVRLLSFHKERQCLDKWVCTLSAVWVQAWLSLVLDLIFSTFTSHTAWEGKFKYWTFCTLAWHVFLVFFHCHENRIAEYSTASYPLFHGLYLLGGNGNYTTRMFLCSIIKNRKSFSPSYYIYYKD